MLEYLILIIATVFCAIYNVRLTIRTRQFYLFSLCIYLILIFGFRYKVGIDTFNYMNSYDLTPSYSEFKQIDWSTNLREPGYMIVCMICRIFTKEFYLLQLIMATITNAGIFIFIYRNCKNPFIALLLYYLMACGYFTTDILRESAAVGIFLFNFRNIQLRNWSRYYLICLVAISFHYSAIITLIIPFLTRLHSNWIYWVIFAGLILSAPLLENLNNMISLAALASRTSGYIEQGGKVNLNFRIANLLHLIIPATLVLYLHNKNKVKIPHISMIWLQLLFCAGVFSVPIIFQRLTNYTILFVIVGLAQVFTSIKLKVNMKLLVISILCLSYSFYYYTNLYRWYPYTSIWDKKDIPQREMIWWHDFGYKKLSL